MSSLYETEPAYVLDQPRFVNAVLRKAIPELELQAALVETRVIERCPACEGAQLYVQRDFNQRAGLVIVVIGAVLAPFTPYYASLFVAAAVDAQQRGVGIGQRFAVEIDLSVVLAGAGHRDPLGHLPGLNQRDRHIGAADRQRQHGVVRERRTHDRDRDAFGARPSEANPTGRTGRGRRRQ